MAQDFVDALQRDVQWRAAHPGPLEGESIFTGIRNAFLSDALGAFKEGLWLASGVGWALEKLPNVTVGTRAGAVFMTSLLPFIIRAARGKPKGPQIGRAYEPIEPH